MVRTLLRLTAREFLGAAAALLLAITLAGCSSTVQPPPSGPRGHEVEGIASWYGPGFDGRRTSSGEIFDQDALTAAHKTLPFGTIVTVHNLDNGRSVELRINDRGPFVAGRIIDLSHAGARAVEMIGPGTARVHLTIESLGGRPVPRTEGDRVAVTGREPVPEIRWFVQVGAFADRQNAEAQADSLRQSGRAAIVIGDGAVNRVRIGPYSERSAAEVVAESMGNEGFSTLVVSGP